MFLCAVAAWASVLDKLPALDKMVVDDVAPFVGHPRAFQTRPGGTRSYGPQSMDAGVVLHHMPDVEVRSASEAVSVSKFVPIVTAKCGGCV